MAVNVCPKFIETARQNKRVVALGSDCIAVSKVNPSKSICCNCTKVRAMRQTASNCCQEQLTGTPVSRKKTILRNPPTEHACMQESCNAKETCSKNEGNKTQPSFPSLAASENIKYWGRPLRASPVSDGFWFQFMTCSMMVARLQGPSLRRCLKPSSPRCARPRGSRDLMIVS